jgi:hypothetical protein
MMNQKLNHQVNLYQVLRARLAEEFPDLDDDTMRDTLEGISDLREIIAAIIRSALVDEALQAGLRLRLEEMRQRFTRLDERGVKKRRLALEAMSEVGLTTLQEPDFSASLRAGAPALVIVSEQEIPEAYWLAQPAKLDRQGLLGELKRGASIPGAELTNSKPVLTVRTK